MVQALQKRILLLFPFLLPHLIKKKDQDRNGGTALVDNNITAASSALFKDADNEDFHLVSTAKAAINQGKDLEEDVTIDFEGKKRPIKKIYDIGAFEYK